MQLSRGGSDAVHVKEFDFVAGDFVGPEENGFVLPEAKSRVSYKSRDVLIVGSDFGPESLTDSGYPRTVREWVRGTPLEEAPIIFEGEKADVSVSAYISDERTWNGGIYEIRARALTFYTTKKWMRRVQPEHLLAPDDPARAGVPDPDDFVEVDVQEDAIVAVHANLLVISLRSDWQPVPGGTVYLQGSALYTPVEAFLAEGAASADFEVLFEPTARTSYSGFTATKNYLMLFTMDNVKEKTEFYKMGDDGLTLTPVGPPAVPEMKSSAVRPLDPYSGSDLFWYSSNDYVTPSTLSLADASLVEKEESFLVKDLKSLPAQYDAAGLVIEQRSAISEDGTEVPYFIVMKKDIVLNGKNPTLLYGYGGFEISLGPHYIATSGLAWLERGGVYVEANIRGGGEFGPSWHQAGKFMKPIVSCVFSFLTLILCYIVFHSPQGKSQQELRRLYRCWRAFDCHQYMQIQDVGRSWRFERWPAHGEHVYDASRLVGRHTLCRSAIGYGALS
jgi:prolyl oligopeptidase